MKKILTLVILVLPFIAMSNDRYRPLEGKWIERNLGNRIVIKQRRDFIRVKGLKRRGSWVSFDQSRNGRGFKDCEGNVIRIGEDGALHYKNRLRGERLHFVRLRKNGRYNSRWNDSFNRSNSRYYRDGNRDRFEGASRGNSYSRDDLRSSDISGIWFSDLLKKRVFIDRNGSGYKAKVGKDGKVTQYSVSRNDRYKFIDRRGNTIVVNSDGSLIWRGGKGYKDVILHRSQN